MIVAVEHKRVHTLDELLTEVEKHRPGQTIRVTVVRTASRSIPVVLGQSDRALPDSARSGPLRISEYGAEQSR